MSLVPRRAALAYAFRIGDDATLFWMETSINSKAAAKILLFLACVTRMPLSNRKDPAGCSFGQISSVKERMVRRLKHEDSVISVKIAEELSRAWSSLVS